MERQVQAISTSTQAEPRACKISPFLFTVW